MRKTKNRICIGCSQPFIGRIDAKTCSAKCRKRVQRARVLYQAAIAERPGRDNAAARPAYELSAAGRGLYAG
jgi:hypothetical protein